MKRLFSVLLLTSLLLLSGRSFAQSAVDIRLNEVLVTNTSGLTDENGERCGWVELFNTAFGMVDVAGFYLTDDKSNPTKYMIPKGNTATVIPLRKYLILYADGNSQKGVFHMNFTLDGCRNLYLYSTDGETLIDEIEIPAELAENKSFGRVKDGEGKHEPVGWSKKSLRKSSDDKKIDANGGFAVLDHPTPGYTNTTKAIVTKSEKMKDMDPWGGILAVTAMGVVFLCLIILYICFKNIGKRAVRKAEQEKAPKAQPAPAKGVTVTAEGGINEEVIAAIAIACHLYQNGDADPTVHDIESNVLTFNKDLLRNSPWGNKMLTIKQDPQIK